MEFTFLNQDKYFVGFVIGLQCSARISKINYANTLNLLYWSSSPTATD